VRTSVSEVPPSSASEEPLTAGVFFGRTLTGLRKWIKWENREIIFTENQQSSSNNANQVRRNGKMTSSELQYCWFSRTKYSSHQFSLTITCFFYQSNLNIIKQGFNLGTLPSLKRFQLFHTEPTQTIWKPPFWRSIFWKKKHKNITAKQSFLRTP